MRLLAVLAHPDDELGCVGTLARHAARGDDVMLAWTTQGELASQFVGVPEAEVRATRLEHAAHAARLIGAEHRVFDMGDSRLTGGRDEALELARLYSEFRPDAVITWSDDHPHPDHRMTAKSAFDAVTLARIPKILDENVEVGNHPPHRAPVRFLQYFSRATPRPAVHVDVTDRIEVATELFRFYREFYGWSYSVDDFLAARAAAGRESGVRYAEKFQRRAAYAPAVPYLEPPRPPPGD